jgi:outer membrane lipoprotein-sorting protein
MKRFVLLLALFIGPSVISLSIITLSFAQDLSTDEVVAKLAERAESLQDATFLITGNLIDADGQEIPLEVNISAMPKESVLKAEFIQPDALADNFIVIDGQDVYNYVYLTNQVSIFKLGDPDALAGLFPSGEGGEPFEFTLNLPALFEGWNVSSQDYAQSPVGNVYTLRFDNAETEDIILSHVDVTVVEDTWLPYSMNFYNTEDKLVAEVVFNDFTTDQALNPEDIRYIDPSAEVIDER